MNVASWNCRGAGGRSFPRILKDMVRKYNINVMGLMETRISGSRADTVVRKLGFSNWLRVEAIGYAGGIWVLWNDWEVKVEYLASTTQLLHCKITPSNQVFSTYVSFVYGDTRQGPRQDLWRTLKRLNEVTQGEWLVLGDFNTFLQQADKQGGSVPSP